MAYTRRVYKTKRTSCGDDCYSKHSHSRTALGECLSWCKFGSKPSTRRAAIRKPVSRAFGRPTLRRFAAPAFRHMPKRQKRFSYMDGNEDNGNDDNVGLITIVIAVVVAIVFIGWISGKK